ncbi:MAG: hypothetical protein ACFFBC_00040 [Promethearchaeota archaeon]
MVQASLQISAPKPKVKYSWQETTFNYPNVLVWEDESFILNYSGSYSDVYNTVHTIEYNLVEGYKIKRYSTVQFDANYTSFANMTNSGNTTIDFNYNVFRVNIDYGSGVKLMWFALKKGVVEYECYLIKQFEHYEYYEENRRSTESTFEKINLTTGQVIDTWTDSDVLFDEINTTYNNTEEEYPFIYRLYWSAEYVAPLFLTIQMYTTEKNDRVAWANLFHNFFIYKDNDNNSIYTVGDKPQINQYPRLSSSTEWAGTVDPMAIHQYQEVESSIMTIQEWAYRPYDKTIDEVASTIIFSPPTEISEADVSWGIEYPDLPLSINVPEENFYTSSNATYAESCPTNLSYNFDFNLTNTQADFDITWGIGKLTNASAYNAVQGYGLLIPQYNFFLSSFDIDEVDQVALSVPRDKFTFESNSAIVAEINMGKPEKKNYTLYDFPSSGVDSEFTSRGSSIHKNVVGYAGVNSYFDNPLTTPVFSLADYVAADTSFEVRDDLFSMETQNYPEWSGEKLVHDPSLTIFYAEISDGVSDESIPGYHMALIMGVISILMIFIMSNYRKRSRYLF